MYHTIVITCGISFNFPRNLFTMIKKEGHNTDFSVDLQAKTITEETKVKIADWFRHCQTLMPEIDNQPERISAEYSAVHALRKAGKLAGRYFE